MENVQQANVRQQMSDRQMSDQQMSDSQCLTDNCPAKKCLNDTYMFYLPMVKNHVFPVFRPVSPQTPWSAWEADKKLEEIKAVLPKAGESPQSSPGR